MATALPQPAPAAQGGSSVNTYQYGTAAVLQPISRAEILQRARQWVSEGVPYSQTAWWTDSLGVYRQDCSGYVSMAWHLDQNVNFWTGNLAAVSHPITQQQLQPGDILLNMSTHTLIFAGWDDSSHTTFSLYQESRPGTDAQYVSGASYAAYANSGFFPYRYNLVDHGGAAQLAVLPAYPTAPVTLPSPPLIAWTDGGGYVSPMVTASPSVSQSAPSVTIGQRKSLAGSSVSDATPMAVEYAVAALLACAWAVQRKYRRRPARHASTHEPSRGCATKETANPPTAPWFLFLPRNGHRGPRRTRRHG